MKILLFAGLRDAVGKTSWDPPTGANTIGEIRQAMIEAYPHLQPLVDRSSFAVDQNYVQDDFILQDSVIEIALIPPVSGG